jgi:hypothetical protein
MVFDSYEWNLVSIYNYPLVRTELEALTQEIIDSAEVAAALVRWGEAIANRPWKFENTEGVYA